MEPFLGSQALKRGALTRYELRTRYRAVSRDVYIGREATLTAAARAGAAWLSTGATLAGLSADVAALADRHPGTRGIRRLRATLELVDGGAESPQETRVRLLLVGAGLPRPETQIEFPELRIRVDMGWREWKVAVEYDGIQHWDNRYQRSWDIERIALLEAAGWIVVRISAEMLSRPHVIVERVRAKLVERGAYGRIRGSSPTQGPHSTP